MDGLSILMEALSRMPRETPVEGSLQSQLRLALEILKETENYTEAGAMAHPDMVEVHIVLAKLAQDDSSPEEHWREIVNGFIGIAMNFGFSAALGKADESPDTMEKVRNGIKSAICLLDLLDISDKNRRSGKRTSLHEAVKKDLEEVPPQPNGDSFQTLPKLRKILSGILKVLDDLESDWEQTAGVMLTNKPHKLS